jgi:hypothetical protein
VKLKVSSSVISKRPQGGLWNDGGVKIFSSNSQNQTHWSRFSVNIDELNGLKERFSRILVRKSSMRGNILALISFILEISISECFKLVNFFSDSNLHLQICLTEISFKFGYSLRASWSDFRERKVCDLLGWECSKQISWRLYSTARPMSNVGIGLCVVSIWFSQ